MKNPSPQVRVAHLQLLLASLDEAAPAVMGEAGAEVPPLIRERIARGHRLSWLPAEYLVELCRAAEARLGTDALEDWGAGVLKRLLRAPLFRAFYEAALWLERRNPAVLLSYSTQAWPLLYQDCGDLFVEERGERFVRLAHVPVPELLRCETTLRPLLGGIAALPRECEQDARIEAEWRPDNPRFVYTVCW